MGIYRAGWNNQASSQVQSDNFAFGTLVNPELWVDAVNGADEAPGSQIFPIQTINEAFSRLGSGYIGLPKIHLVGSGTFSLGASPKLVVPSPSGSSFARAVPNAPSQPPLILGDSSTTDALGTLTVGVGSTAGTNQPPNPGGTLVDGTGGFTTDAHVGKFIRFLTGALAGQRYIVAANSSTTFTIVSIFSGAPTTGDTYVLETPAPTISWTGTLFLVGAANALGMYNVNTVGSMEIRGVTLMQSLCRFTSIGAMQCFSGGHVQNLGLGGWSVFGSLPSGAQQLQGSYFQAASAGQIVLNGGQFWQTLVCLYNNVRMNAQQSTIQSTDSYFRGNASVAFQNQCNGILQRHKFNAVIGVPNVLTTPGAGAPQAAAVSFSQGSSGTVLDTDISNTPATQSPGHGVNVADGSHCNLLFVTGTGNAALGCNITDRSTVRNGTHTSGNSITGASGDFKLGGNAASAGSGAGWSGAPAFATDLAAGSPQLCTMSTP